MCSIIGCYWSDEVAAILVKSLQRMEYRGYDSVGISTYTNQLHLAKGIGKVAEVDQKHSLSLLPGKVGIGHTRWATHGKVCEINAHPHVASELNNVAVVHNGIIDNHEQLRAKLKCEFKSETDTEVIANLLGYYYSQVGDAKVAMMRTIKELKGRYSFIALFDNGVMAAARYHEPLILGIANFGIFLASDIIGFAEHTDNVIYLDNQEFVIIDPDNQFQAEIYNFRGKAVSHKVVKISKELIDVGKEDYAHFTLKEIHEQPEKINRSYKSSTIEMGTAVAAIKTAKSIFITGSGTSYNAALIAKQLLSPTVSIDAIISSESQFSHQRFDRDSILIAISQSGESADVLDTVNLAKKQEAKIIALVNNTKSSLAQLADCVINLDCGPEIGVAATKSFTAQLTILYRFKELLNNEQIINIKKITEAIKEILRREHEIKNLAKKLKDVKDIYILGRGIHCPIASEASLKLKELAYIHAEGLPGGELKHGPLALMDEFAYTILLNPTDITHLYMLNSASQIKSRGAKIIGISNKNHPYYDHWIEIPSLKNDCYPFIEIIPIQLLAYYLALEKNTDPDYPRNLAKSVTTH